MRECGSFIEIGVKSLEEGKNEYDVNEIEGKIRSVFPGHACTFCVSTYKNYYPGWTVGVVEGWDSQVEAVAKAFPKTRFVVKEVDNYGITLFDVVVGKHGVSFEIDEDDT